MREKKRDLGVLLIVVALVLLCDRISKYLVVSGLSEGQSRNLAAWLTSVFHITYVTNTGAAFGLLPGWGGFFIVVAVIVIVVLVMYYIHLPDGQWLVRIALGLQLGGAIGNLIDRLHQGAVVDFIDLNFWPLQNWPIFNLADASIVTGVVILTAVMFWEEWREQKGHQIAKPVLEE